MSCDRCGNATWPLAEHNGEMLCDGCWKTDVLSFLEANPEDIEANVIGIMLRRMVPVSSEIPDGANRKDEILRLTMGEEE